MLTGTMGNPTRNHIAGSPQENELHLLRFCAENVPVSSLERRTGENNSDILIVRDAEPSCERTQPSRSIFVTKRNSRGHPLDILRRVEFVAFNKFNVERAGELRSDQALPGARNAHHDIDPRIHEG